MDRTHKEYAHGAAAWVLAGHAGQHIAVSPLQRRARKHRRLVSVGKEVASLVCRSKNPCSDPLLVRLASQCMLFPEQTRCAVHWRKMVLRTLMHAPEWPVP